MYPKCKNCGAPEDLHRSDTNQCPFAGEDQSGQRPEVWLETTYEALAEEITPRETVKVSDDLELAFANAMHALDGCRLNLFEKTEAAIARKINLDAARNKAILENIFDGKNAEIREAQAREHFRLNYDELSAFEADERRAKLEFDLAQSALDLLRYRLRIAELTKDKNI